MVQLEKLYSSLGLTIRTRPYAHQIAGLLKSGGRPYFAQLGEQGTGKTWILINEAAILYAKGDITSALVLAPKGVDSNWLIDQLPKHMPEGIQWTAALWRANPLVKQRLALQRLMEGPGEFSLAEKGKDQIACLTVVRGIHGYLTEKIPDVRMFQPHRTQPVPQIIHGVQSFSRATG